MTDSESEPVYIPGDGALQNFIGSSFMVLGHDDYTGHHAKKDAKISKVRIMSKTKFYTSCYMLQNATRNTLHNT